MRNPIALKAACLCVLLASTNIAQAKSPTTPESEPVRYLVNSQLFKNGVSLFQHQDVVPAGQAVPFSHYADTPYISGVSHNSAQPGKPEILKSTVKTGYAYVFSCQPGGLQQIGKVVCHVQLDAAENLTPQMASNETQ